MLEKLNRFEKNITSKDGEDGIIDYICGVIGDKLVKVACEFGAWDGVHISNAYNLWHNKGFKGVLIEGDTSKYDILKKNTAGKDVTIVSRYVAIRGKDSLDDIFKSEGLSPEVGVLVIDIDSFDYHVFKNIEYVDAQIILVEHNEKIPPYIDYYDPEETVYLRCSAKAIERVGREKGYRAICCTLLNTILVREDLFDPEKFPDAPVEYLFDYSAIPPQVIFSGRNRNRFPVFTKETRKEKKLMTRLGYRLEALFKKKVTYKPPSSALEQHLKKLGLDL